MPDISVVIPTYNRGALVCEAVESVLEQQTRRSLEVIVVDDGSTDNTGELLSNYSGRISYLRQPNRGVNAARNEGIRAASAELIALLDSDDVWLPFKIELQVDVLERLPDAGFVFSDFFIWRGAERRPNGLKTWVVDDKDIQMAVGRTFRGTDLDLASAWHEISVSLCDIYALSLFRPVVLPSTSIVRRKVFDVEGLFPEDNWMCGDWEFFARASKRFPSAYIDTETSLNRSHDDGVRLMRRDLSDRTQLRLASLRRLWKADHEFMVDHAPELLDVETKELAILFKEACTQGRRHDARGHLRELSEIQEGTPLKWMLWYVAMGLPPVRAVANRMRGQQ